MTSGQKDVKNLAAMWEKRTTITAKPRDLGPASARGDEKPKIGKLQVSSVFGAKKADTLPLNKAQSAGVGGASSQSSKDVGSLKNTFEPKKATTNQTQDKSKFLTKEADTTNKIVDNPFLKKQQASATMAVGSSSSSALQSKPAAFGNTFVPKVFKKPEPVQEKPKEEPKAAPVIKSTPPPADPAEKKMNPFELAQLKRKEEEAKKLQEKRVSRIVGSASAGGSALSMSKSKSEFESKALQKKEEDKKVDKKEERPATAAPPEKKLNPFELAMKKKQEEQAAKTLAQPRKSVQPLTLPKFKQDIVSSGIKRDLSRDGPGSAKLPVEKLKPFNPVKSTSAIKPRNDPVPGTGGLAPITEKDGDDFKKSLAALIGRPKPGKKKPAAQPAQDEPKQKIKANLFDDDAQDDFGADNSRTQKRQAPKKTNVDFFEFADTKPTFAARRDKVKSIAGGFQDFTAQRRRVGTVAAKKTVTFSDSDDDN